MQFNHYWWGPLPQTHSVMWVIVNKACIVCMIHSFIHSTTLRVHGLKCLKIGPLHTLYNMSNGNSGKHSKWIQNHIIELIICTFYWGTQTVKHTVCNYTMRCSFMDVYSQPKSRYWKFPHSTKFPLMSLPLCHKIPSTRTPSLRGAAILVSLFIS